MPSIASARALARSRLAAVHISRCCVSIHGARIVRPGASSTRTVVTLRSVHVDNPRQGARDIDRQVDPRPAPDHFVAAMTSGRTARNGCASRADADAADHWLLLEPNLSGKRDRAIANGVYASPGPRNSTCYKRAHMRVSAAPARRNGLDVQHVDEQRIAGPRTSSGAVTGFPRPANGRGRSTSSPTGLTKMAPPRASCVSNATVVPGATDSTGGTAAS